MPSQKQKGATIEELEAIRAKKAEERSLQGEDPLEVG